METEASLLCTVAASCTAGRELETQDKTDGTCRPGTWVLAEQGAVRPQGWHSETFEGLLCAVLAVTWSEAPRADLIRFLIVVAAVYYS